MMYGTGLLVFIGVLLCPVKYISTADESSLIWFWKCDRNEEACTRISSSTNDSDDTVYPSLETCRLVCGSYGALWPQPTGNTELSDQLFMFSISSIKFVLPDTDNDVKNFLQEATRLFIKSISTEDISKCNELTNSVTVSFDISSNILNLSWNTSESYDLTVSTQGSQNSVKIKSDTIFGARHALETLSQLIDVYPSENNIKCLVVVQDAKITDAPIYPHRGLLLDTGRNFLSLDSIKKHIDGMGFSKLNVLHWHITDSQSFPLELPNLPNMTKYGAYAADKVYQTSDIKEILSYATLRGVRVIIEIDAPSHSGNGWQWGANAGLGNLAVCVNQQPYRSYCIQPPCGQLNPINPNLYNVLKDLYENIVSILPKGEVFHMGGDEVFIPCWNSTPEIINYFGNKSRTTEAFLDLWSEYQAKALAAFDLVVGNANTPIILWTSHLTEVAVIEKYLPKKRYVIQTWVPAADTLPNDLLKLGYRIIVSTKDTWYLDHGFWGTTIYHNWRTVYDNHIPSNTGTLGGEVCMWGEYVDDRSIEPKVWPRAAAAAERLWSNPSTDANQAERRFYRYRERLVSRNINAEALIPKWCYQNEGEC